jgi:hypothetical protein
LCLSRRGELPAKENTKVGKRKGSHPCVFLKKEERKKDRESKKKKHSSKYR